ncbi:hypothetical protein DFH11DRAFT_1769465 [Phellopilus nigrolimitatus]|nr:hypothetical protein DFH11DRAFT_1769465 [Phellopilus nigrolimitatus]
MSSSAAIPIESLIPLVRDAHTVDRSGVAATACLIYDIVITWDQEVEHIWNAGQLIIMGVEISLMLRVYALYKRDRRILALIVFLYISEVTALSVILGLALRRIVSIAPLRGIFPADFPLSGCFPEYVPSYFYSYWIPSLIFESILFVLMTINFVRCIRGQKTAIPLLNQFFRDGTVYYAVIFVTLLTNVLLYELVNSALAQVAIGWELTVFSIAGSRLILNLRVSGSASRTPAGTAEVATLEMMRFGDNPSALSRAKFDAQAQSVTYCSELGSPDAEGSASIGAALGHWGGDVEKSERLHEGVVPSAARMDESGANPEKETLSRDDSTEERRDWISEWENV